ncbi:hypothetical protein BGAFAR04_C0024 (plasmid) [Borreliella garinii Far04]|nr:hypothetical protein BGAFAR04_C0024 [Borreliella garinii Far04]
MFNKITIYDDILTHFDQYLRVNFRNECAVLNFYLFIYLFISLKR